jgi:hypothetical protein
VTEHFETALLKLESLRQRVLRDRQAYSFAAFISGLLTVLSLFALLVNPSFLFALICVSLGAFTVICLSAGLSADGDYQRKFSAAFTRGWIHSVFPEIYFTHASQAPLALDPVLVAIMKPVLHRDPAQFHGYEKLMFDKDPHHTTVFLLERRGIRGFSFAKLSTLIWFMPLDSAHPFTSDEKMLDAGERAKRLAGSDDVTIARTAAGLWLAVDGIKTPFKAPVGQSCFDVKAYEQWMTDAHLPFSNEMREILASLR